VSGELISLLSVCVAALSAVYARWAARLARRANEIAVETELKPRRLVVYASLRNFLHFCSIYGTMQSVKSIDGTRDLVAEIEAFGWEIEQHGPLDMPEVDTLVKIAIKNAWQLQRVLDRIAGPNPTPIDSVYASAEDNLDGLVEWFASRKGELRNLFDPYLRIRQQ
jgi:hypothetical protein